jgi:hypothetical protein
MDQKRFKYFREPATIKRFEAGEDRIEVQQDIDHYDIVINDQVVETFKTKEMALTVAEQTAEALKDNK